MTTTMNPAAPAPCTCSACQREEAIRRAYAEEDVMLTDWDAYIRPTPFQVGREIEIVDEDWELSEDELMEMIIDQLVERCLEDA